MTSGLVSRQYPERVALVAEDGTVLRYAELHSALTDWAAALAPRHLVFIIGGNDLPTVLCYLAALEHGAVPLLLAAGLASDALERLIHTYRPTFILAPDNLLAAGSDATLLRREGRYGLYRRHNADTPVLHERLALLLTTSGSTGSPKLVRLTAGNVRTNAASIAGYLGITPDERAITSLPFNYSYGLSVINSHLHAGASVALSDRSLMDAGFWRQIDACEVTSFAGVPYTYDMLLKLRLARIKMPSVRTLTQAGGRMAADRQREVYEICQARGIRFVPMYGQTEATARIAWLPPEALAHKAGSIGRAIPGGRMWIERSDGAVVTEPGVTGELIYAGANVSMGYAESADDLKLGDVNQGVLRTGDLARFDEDGFFYIEGRLKRFLKIFGNRLSLDAIEQLAAEKGYACAAHGEDDRLVMHVVQTPKMDAAALRTEIAATLGIHASALTVLSLPELPRLPTGKVDYQCLSQLP